MAEDHTPEGSKATTAASTAVTVLAIVAVALRFWTRRIIKVGYGWDDWWILIGVLLLLATGATLLYGIFHYSIFGCSSRLTNC